MTEVRRLGPDDVALVAAIDRSEQVEVEYAVVDGQLTQRAITMVDVPRWDPVGTGDFTVAHQVEFCATAIAGGGTLLGAFDEAEMLGLAIVNPSFEPPMAWLAFLHVSRAHRRSGVASALWHDAAEVAAAAGATTMYVSATPTGSAIGFYLSRGCQLADPVHPDLFALEPDDIHLVCPLP